MTEPWAEIFCMEKKKIDLKSNRFIHRSGCRTIVAIVIVNVIVQCTITVQTINDCQRVEYVSMDLSISLFVRK